MGVLVEKMAVMENNSAVNYVFTPPDTLELESGDKNQPKHDKDSMYFKCYENLDLHSCMMKDRQRVGFYYRAMTRNPDLFKGKTVLDVGSGLGILSLFAAQAGAKKVYAVEASTKIAKLAEEAFWENNFDDIIEQKIGKIEDIEIEDNIDIIVSEWMGYCLLYELMLPSVIFARDKYKPDIMIPGQAAVLICGFFDEKYFEERYGWTKTKLFDWIDMSSWSSEVSRRIVTRQILSKRINTTSTIVKNIDLFSIDQEQCRRINETEFEIRFRNSDTRQKSANTIHGIVIYFDVYFNQGRDGKMILTNSPHGELTHWQQSLCLFEEPVKIKHNKQSIKGKFKLEPISESQSRGIKINVELDKNYVETEKHHYEFIQP